MKYMAKRMHPAGIDVQHVRLAVPASHLECSGFVSGKMHMLPRTWDEALHANGVEKARRGSVK